MSDKPGQNSEVGPSSVAVSSESWFQNLRFPSLASHLTAKIGPNSQPARGAYMCRHFP